MNRWKPNSDFAVPSYSTICRTPVPAKNHPRTSSFQAIVLIITLAIRGYTWESHAVGYYEALIKQLLGCYDYS